MYATFDSNGKPTGFYCEEIHGDNIPGDAIAINDEDYTAFVNEQGRWIYLDGLRVAAPIIPPTNEEIILRLTAALESHYDSVARTRRYDTRYTCALRAGYPGPFHDEGTAFAVWMDTCNALAYQIMQDCLDGRRAIPTADELIGGMPDIEWPS